MCTYSYYCDTIEGMDISNDHFDVGFVLISIS